MKEQTKKNLKTAAIATGAVLGATYLVIRHIVKKQYPNSIYANQPEEQNPMQGRNVTASENKDLILYKYRGKQHLFRYKKMDIEGIKVHEPAKLVLRTAEGNTKVCM